MLPIDGLPTFCSSAITWDPCSKCQPRFITILGVPEDLVCRLCREGQAAAATPNARLCYGQCASSTAGTWLGVWDIEWSRNMH